MAAPEQTIPGLTDLRSFTHVLDFVANREKYSKRIAFLEEKTQECNTAVQRVVALNALGALQAQVKKDRLTADEVLAAAVQDAEEVRSAAQKRADDAAAEISETKKALRLQAETENERLSTWEKGLEHREETCDGKKRAAEAELASAETLHKKGQKLQERYGNALVALTKITNEV